MKNRSIWGILLVSAMALLASCQHLTGPKQATSYYLIPDTLRGMLGQNYSFTMRSSTDSTWLASKYLWDLGDGRPVYSIANSNSTSFLYSSTGVYRVTATAMDSLDDVLAQARGVAIIGKLSAKVTITPHNPTVTAYAPIVFTVRIDPNVPVNYEWNFGDGTPDVTYVPYDTISHLYAHNGTYSAIVTAVYDGYPVGSDTAIVSVALPTTTLSAISGMTHVSARFLGSDTESLTLPIQNAGEYSFTTSGLSFQAAYNHAISLTLPRGSTDTTSKRIISASLSTNGRYLILPNVTSFDSSYYQYDSLQIYCTGSYHWNAGPIATCPGPPAADSLMLISASADSLVFATLPGTVAVLYGPSKSSTTVVPANGRIPDCPVDTCAITMNPLLLAEGRGTITFWK